MKTRKFIAVLMLSALTTGIFAQPQVKRTQLTEEQKEQMTEVREKYAPKMQELRNELRVKKAEQDALLSKKIVDEKAVYANIDATAAIKTEMLKNTAALRGEMKEICPNDGQGQFAGRQHLNGPRNGMGQGQGQRPRNGQGYAQGKGQTAQQGQMQGSGQGNGVKQGAHQKQAYAQGRGQGNRAGNKQGMGQGRGQEYGNRGLRGNGQGLNQGRGFGLDLTEEQQAKMTEIKTAHFWGIQETQSEIELLKAQNADAEAKVESIDELSALQTKLAKQKMAMRLEMRDVLTEEQLMTVVAKQDQRGRRGGNARMHHGRRI